MNIAICGMPAAIACRHSAFIDRGKALREERVKSARIKMIRVSVHG